VNLRSLDPVDEVLVAKGFLQKIERPRLHPLDGHRNVAVTGDEDAVRPNDLINRHKELRT
jgi:hypothetical protein